MACVRCFREYATEVYTAADDLPMAMHHSKSIAGHTGPWSNRGDRRWLGLKNEAWLLMFSGQIENAIEVLRRSLPLTQEEDVGVKGQARLEVLSDLEHALVMAGQLDATVPSPEHRSPLPAAAALPGADPNKPLPKGEWPWLDVRHGMTDALRACCRGDHSEAQEILTHWDRWLTERKHLSDWFEVRLRLVAAMRLARQQDRAAALAKQLGDRARQARDWLTLRRLTRLMDDAEPLSPLALLSPVAVGPYASKAVTQSVPEQPLAVTAAPAEQAAAPPAEAPPPPLDGFIVGMAERLESARDDDEVRGDLLSELLSVPPTAASHHSDAARLIHLTHYLIGDGGRGPEVWRWAEAVATPHPQDASVLSLLAVLGDLLRSQSEAMAELIPVDRVQRLFRASLGLDPFHVRNHSRAGDYYLHEGDLGEAERCLARGFRLDRNNSFLALRLAEVYRKTERPRDALAVLDMALREDSDDPQVAWEAALTAFNLQQWESTLTYIDCFEGMNPDQPWANYYKTIALLELNRPREALEAVAEEERRSPDRPWPQMVLRACAYAALEDAEQFRHHLHAAVTARFADVDYLTVSGVSSLSERLWKAAGKLPADNPLRKALNEKLLQAGVMPDDYFEELRMCSEKEEGINYYRIFVRQLLDENWEEWPGRLHDQEGWTGYFILWGVLAKDEEDAKERVLQWQAKCYPAPAWVAKTEVQSEDYNDRPGVVWQGERWGQNAAEDESPEGA
jgi:tetratricopeptide (TPR) repeat protein